MQNDNPIFHSEATIKDTFKNGGWRSLSFLLVLLVILFFFSDFNWNTFKASWVNITYVIFSLLFLLYQFISGIKEIKIVKDKILLRKSFPNKWKELDISQISHIAFYSSPIEEQGSIFPTAIIYPIENHKRKIIKFEIKKSDIYRFLSILQDYGKDVLIFEKQKNIKETEFYVPNINLEIREFHDQKHIIVDGGEGYKSSNSKYLKTAGILFNVSILLIMFKLLSSYKNLNQFFFFFNLLFGFSCWAFAVICNRGGAPWVKWGTLIMLSYYIIEFTSLTILDSHSLLLYAFIILQIMLTISILKLLLTKLAVTHSNYSVS